MTIREALAAYLTHKHDLGLSDDTLSNYTTLVNKMQEYFDNDLDVAQLTPERMEAWFNHLCAGRGDTEQKYSPRSVRLWWTESKNFAKFLAKKKYVAVAPIPEVDLPRLDAPYRPRVNDDELLALLASLENEPDEYRRALRIAIVHTMISAALRCKEITYACLGDLHLSENFLHIPHGKGDKPGNAPLNDDAIFALRQYLALRPASGSDRLFLPSATREFSRQTMRRLLKTIARNAGFDDFDLKRFVPHAVRRRGLDNAYEQTNDIRIAQALGRQSSAQVTEMYLNPKEKDLIRQRNMTRLHPTAPSDPAPVPTPPAAPAVPIVPAPLSPETPELQALAAQLFKMLLAMGQTTGQTTQTDPPLSPSREQEPPGLPFPRPRKRTDLRRS